MNTRDTTKSDTFFHTPNTVFLWYPWGICPNGYPKPEMLEFCGDRVIVAQKPYFEVVFEAFFTSLPVPKKIHRQYQKSWT